MVVGFTRHQLEEAVCFGDVGWWGVKEEVIVFEVRCLVLLPFEVRVEGRFHFWGSLGAWGRCCWFWGSLEIRVLKLCVLVTLVAWGALRKSGDFEVRMFGASALFGYGWHFSCFSWALTLEWCALDEVSLMV